MVVIGTPDEESSQIFAETVTSGDPTYVGPLAGVALNLDVYHVLDNEVKMGVDGGLYDEQVGLMEDALPSEALAELVRSFRAS